MAEEEEEENKVPKVDPIVFLRDWFKTRVLSSLKCKEDLVNKLVDIEPSAAAVDSFWKESEVQRLIVYFKDADLIAVRSNPTSHPPPQHRIIGDLPDRSPIILFFHRPDPQTSQIILDSPRGRVLSIAQSSFADRPALPSTPTHRRRTRRISSRRRRCASSSSRPSNSTPTTSTRKSSSGTSETRRSNTSPRWRKRSSFPSSPTRGTNTGGRRSSRRK